MTTDTIFGIISIDHPELTDDQFRAIQLGEETHFPDGSSVADYIAEVEALKEANIERAAAERQVFLGSIPEPENTEDTDPEDTENIEQETPTEEEEVVIPHPDDVAYVEGPDYD